MEIPFVVGQYTMLSMVAKTTDVPIDETLPGWPEGREPAAARSTQRRPVEVVG